MKNYLKMQGFEYRSIQKPHPAKGDLEFMIRTIESYTLEKKSDPIKKSGFDFIDLWLVLDGYHFEPEYQEKLKETGCNLLVIDDKAHLQKSTSLGVVCSDLLDN